MIRSTIKKFTTDMWKAQTATNAAILTSFTAVEFHGVYIVKPSLDFMRFLGIAREVELKDVEVPTSIVGAFFVVTPTQWENVFKTHHQVFDAIANNIHTTDDQATVLSVYSGYYKYFAQVMGEFNHSPREFLRNFSPTDFALNAVLEASSAYEGTFEEIVMKTVESNQKGTPVQLEFEYTYSSLELDEV